MEYIRQKREPTLRIDSLVNTTLFAVYYSATTLSAATVLSAATTLSATTLSTTTLSESQHAPCSVLLPQEAKETATTAANTKANFFIFLLF